MKQFVFLYPIQEYINHEIENGSYSWKCKPWMNKWGKIFESLNDEEKDRIRPKALKEKQTRFRPYYSRVFNKCIDKRYRKKGFKINYVIFADHSISDLMDIKDYDKIIECDVDFKTHITKQEDGSYIYPDNNFILDQLGDASLIRIAGFHMWDCVQKIAKDSYHRWRDTLVDEDLTEFFNGRLRDSDFRVDKYPTFNPFKYDISKDNHLSENFFKARKDRPWLWQNYHSKVL